MACPGEAPLVGTGEILEKRDVSICGKKSSMLGAWKTEWFERPSLCSI